MTIGNHELIACYFSIYINPFPPGATLRTHLNYAFVHRLFRNKYYFLNEMQGWTSN